MSTAYPDTQLLINGQWQAAASGKQIAVRNPATGETWTGRGKAPKWIDGQEREQYLIVE